jgi:hypothetical protein
MSPAEVRNELVYLLGTYAAENLRLSAQEIGSFYAGDPIRVDYAGDPIRVEAAIALAKTATHFLETARLITADKHPQMDAGLVLRLATDLLERAQP